MKRITSDQVTCRGFFCPKCEIELVDTNIYLILTNDDVAKCPACTEELTIDSVDARIEADNASAPLLDRDTAQSATWFHATRDENWLESFEPFFDAEIERGWFEAHAGTEMAAFDRAIGEYVNPGGTGFWLYEVRLKDGVELSDKILADSNSALNMENDGVPNRYLNRWEDPASIAIVARHTDFEIVSRRWVEPAEALARPNLYNLGYDYFDR